MVPHAVSHYYNASMEGGGEGGGEGSLLSLKPCTPARPAAPANICVDVILAFSPKVLLSFLFILAEHSHLFGTDGIYLANERRH